MARDNAQRRTYRWTVAVVVACVWFVIAAWVALDAVVRGSDRSAVVAVLLVAAVSGAVWLLFVRPAVVVTEEGVEVRNVLTDVFVPWHLVRDVDGGGSLRVHVDDATYPSWAVHSSHRSMRRALVTPVDAQAGTDRSSLEPSAAEGGRAAEVAREVTVVWQACGPETAGERRRGYDGPGVLVAVLSVVAVVVALAL